MSTSDFSILHQDGLAQAALIKKGDISPLELLEISIAALEKLNPQLNAVITPMYAEAREVAQNPLADSPFAGVPFLLKDIMGFYKGVRATSGSKLFQHFIADHDTELVSRYKKAGLVIFGKTNVPEFGLLPTTESEAFGPCHNPWNLEHSTGGSSGGSSAAVAARIVAMAHANDGGGSIRIPAACCGLFGLKPSRGRNPLGPQMTEAISGLGAEHIVCRSVRDSAAMLDITSGPAPGDPYWAPPKSGPFLDEVGKDPGKLVIAYDTGTPLGGSMGPEAEACLEASIKLCKSLGHEVVEKKMPISMPPDRIMEAFSVIWSTAAGTPLGMMKHLMGIEPQSSMVEPLTWAFYELSQRATALDYELARLATQNLSRELGVFFEGFDVWMSPTLAKAPLPLGQLVQNPDNPFEPFQKASDFAPFTALNNITGQPAASIPLYWTDQGLPLGTHFATKYGDEATLFRLAAQLEKAQPWINKLPPTVV